MATNWIAAMDKAEAEDNREIAERKEAVEAGGSTRMFQWLFDFTWGLMKWFTILGALYSLTPVIWITRAWAVHRLWVWFVTPAFGIAAPNPVICFGLVCFWGVIAMKGYETKDEEEFVANAKKPITFHFKVAFSQACAPFICVGLAWIMKWCGAFGMKFSWFRYFMETGMLW